jgi:hypothetical protein
LISRLADVFSREEEELTHSFGYFWRFDNGGHAVFAVIDKSNIVAEDIDFDRGTIFVRGEKSAGK